MLDDPCAPKRVFDLEVRGREDEAAATPCDAAARPAPRHAIATTGDTPPNAGNLIWRTPGEGGLLLLLLWLKMVCMVAVMAVRWWGLTPSTPRHAPRVVRDGREEEGLPQVTNVIFLAVVQLSRVRSCVLGRKNVLDATLHPHHPVLVTPTRCDPPPPCLLPFDPSNWRPSPFARLHSSIRATRIQTEL